MTERATNPIPENKVGSREFEEAMQVFERNFLGFKGNPKTIREDRDTWKYSFYKDGYANEKFKGFLHGMAYARQLVNLDQ